MEDIDLSSMSTGKMLEEVNKAIVTVMVGGQSYKIGSRSLTRADLGQLKELRKTLAAEVAQGEQDKLGGAFVARFEGR